MALHFQDSLRIDTSTIHHDRELTVSLIVLGSYDGNGLSCLHTLPHLHKVLGIVGIDGFQSIIMTDDDNIALALCLARQTHMTIKHRLDSIPLGSLYLEHTIARQQGCLTYRKWKGIFLTSEYLEIDIESLATVEKSRRSDTDLLLFGRGKKILDRREGGKQSKSDAYYRHLIIYMLILH